jgi:hypothetical protein
VAPIGVKKVKKRLAISMFGVIVNYNTTSLTLNRTPDGSGRKS